MDFKNRMKKMGFSLMEILIAIFIVAILAMVTVPIINRQMEKTEEYSYYLAYRTVEKLSGQIVALGDPDEIALNMDDTKIAKKKEPFGEKLARLINLNGIKVYLASLQQRFVHTETYILKHFIPKTMALSVEMKDSVGEWSTEDYDELWLAYHVCNGENIVKAKKEQIINNEDGTTTTKVVDEYYTKSDFNNCDGYTKENIANQLKKNENILTAFFEFPIFVGSETALSAETATFLLNQTEKPNAKAFCTEYYRTKGAGKKTIDDIEKNIEIIFEEDVESDIDDDEDEGKDESDEATAVTGQVSPPTSEVSGYCRINATYTVNYSEEDPDQNVSARPSFAENWCTVNGYVNMTNTGYPDTISCECKPGFIPSYNNEKACFQPCTEKDEAPYSNKTGGRVCCSTDYDTEHQKCCPKFSTYSETEKKCVCISLYKEDGGKCVLDTCPPGSTKKDDVCVVNPPIIKAENFCNQITKHWNISSSHCTGFSTSNDTKYNESVYNAAMGNNNGKYLSIDAQKSAFKNITPNITFSNGLKMWILGDKAASITGLSYYPNPYADNPVTSSQNMCRRIENVHSAIGCYNANGYFCKSENVCLTMDDNSKAQLRDARNCCGALDMSDVQLAAASAGKDWKEDPTAYAVGGFTIFVDINGDKGDGTLWDDVYPFFVGANGTVYPGYPLDAPKGENAISALYLGGNSEKQLPTDVYYYNSTDESRERKLAFAGVSYARAVCSARKLSKFTPYCMNLGEKFNGGTDDLKGSSYIQDDNSATSKNPCDKYNCFVSVRQKLKSF